MQPAACLHRLFVEHLCTELAGVADARVVCVSPETSLERVRSELELRGLGQAWAVMPQGAGNLGARMQRWFIHCLGPGQSSASLPRSGRAILIGADCPLLDAERIRRADQQLQSHDVVLGPAADGGYYLIGIRGPWQSQPDSWQRLFDDVPWSTDQVLAITRERCLRGGLSMCELDTLEDIDTIEELNRLRASLHSRQGQPVDSATLHLQESIERILTGDWPSADGYVWNAAAE